VTRSDRRGPLVVGVAVLRKHPGTQKRVKITGSIPELEVSDSRVPPDSNVEVDVLLESVLGGMVVSGTVSGHWEGECRRCLETATGTLSAQVRELYSDDADPELGYPMTADWLDLEPLAHDACILELPLALLCGPDCLGLCPECGANRNHETCTCSDKTDPRWAALSGLGAPQAIPEWRE
jgi:uncharacterized protein